jgi:ubiquinone/menaquinone biosynthesis C-methylase UbiE
MTDREESKGDYGIDAPLVVRNLIIAAVLCLLLALLLLAKLLGTWIGDILGSVLLISFLTLSFTAGYMVWTSKIAKYHERDRILDLVSLKGSETILDVGCGRGLLLNGAARRLFSGEAVGIDVWQKKDQSGNDPHVTRANAMVEGVAARIEIITSDMRKMPFRNNRFDTIVSNIAIHNLSSLEERRMALREIIRVLKPGGRFAIGDFRNTSEYARYFANVGVRDIQKVGLHYRTFPPVQIITGLKPAS